LLPEKRAPELTERLFRVDDVTETARTIIEAALDEEDHHAARMVIRALESKDPKHPLVVEFGGKVRAKPDQ
ncbi:MAG: hypothetical protein JRI68_18210, partial [Deltaproteobacteria bacterium]|nr:hypothetical protein [Deltaproteobacteria bacterium]